MGKPIVQGCKDEKPLNVEITQLVLNFRYALSTVDLGGVDEIIESFIRNYQA